MKKSILLLICTHCFCALLQAQTGNTATGISTGTLGDHNSFFGYYTGNAAIGGSMYNAFFGSNSGQFTSGGYFNTGVGALSLYTNNYGNYNTASGALSLYFNSGGQYNTANGVWALYHNTSGNFNTADGVDALALNTTGIYNTAAGNHTLYSNTTGTYNSAFGYNAGTTSNNLTNTTALGNGALVPASNYVRIGNTAVTVIGGQVSWSTLSDGRFKKEIKEDVSGLAFINQLRPVSYSVDTEALDRFLGIPESELVGKAETRKIANRQTGFIAQEVEQVIKSTGFVFHGVVPPQNEKDHYSIRYSEFVVPLVKAVQELTSKLEKQQEKIDLLLTQLNKKGQISDEVLGSGGVMLFQNAPNPFSADTKIQLAVPEGVRQVSLIFYNMQGTQLKSIPIQDRGQVEVKISSNELGAGMYLYSLIVDNKVVDTKRMILTK